MSLNEAALAARDKAMEQERMMRAMEMSPEIGKLAEALAAAQAEIKGAIRDSDNPFFKSKYADLASCWEACRGPLTSHGLAVIQGPSADGTSISVTTVLVHSSGQWMRSTLTTVTKDTSPQTVGSATTYLRRYGLAAMVGIAPEDDDGNAAQGNDAGQKPPPRGGRSWRGPTVGAPQGGAPGVETSAAEAQETFPDPKPPRERMVVPSPVLGGGEIDAETERIADDSVQREALLKVIDKQNGLLKKTPEDKHTHWTTYCGKATPSTATIKNLKDLVAFNALRMEQKGKP